MFSCSKRGVICPTLRRYFVSMDVAFFETTSFSLPSTVTSLREDDDLLVYYVSLPVPTPTPIPVKPPITQVYSRRQNPPVSSPPPIGSTLDPVSSKVNVSVFTQFPHFVLITIYHHIHVLLLHPWILSRFLTLSVRFYLTLVGVVLW